MARIRRPDTVRLSISQGDWLLVKKHLTAGEQRRQFARMVKKFASVNNATPSVEIEPTQVGRSLAVEYLLDWSIVDADGKPVKIADQSPDVVGNALDELDIDSFNEIVEAVQAHDTAMQAERDAEKNAKDGGSASSATLPSVA